MKKKLIFAVLVAGFPLVGIGPARASTISTSTVTQLIRLTSYNQFDGGDVTLEVSNPPAACPDGYWLNKSDAGFSANLSMLIAAYEAKTTLTISALPDQLWPGTSGTVCKLYDIQYHP